MAGKKFPHWLLIFSGIFLIAIIWLLVPFNTKNLVSNPHPSQDYAQSVARIEALQNRDLPRLSLECRPQVLDHGKKVQQVIVFIHGHPNCPKQFSALAEIFYNQGYNVLNLPLPHHGLIDRMTTDAQRMKAEEFVAYADETVDLAQGLGERVTVVGFSAGGTVAAWIAQTRSDVDYVVVISPGLDFKVIPTGLTRVATRLALTLPNVFVWADPDAKESGGQPHTYPRYSTRTLAQLLRLGFAVQERAREQPPQAYSILIVTNDNDPDLNNEMTDRLANLWSAHGAKIARYEFEKELGLPHEIIDPTHPFSRTDIVYPRLIPLLQR